MILDFRNATANSIYVGLSRVTNADQIRGFVCDKVIDHMLTYLTNDEFYYKLSKPTIKQKTFLSQCLVTKTFNPNSPDFIKLFGKLQMITVQRKGAFEQTDNMAKKINRKCYELEEESTTSCDQITKILLSIQEAKWKLFEPAFDLSQLNCFRKLSN